MFRTPNGGLDEDYEKTANTSSTIGQKLMMFIQILTMCLIKSAAAPLAWLLVGLLKGEHGTCALWPTRAEDLPDCWKNLTSFPMPCQIPSTLGESIANLPDGCPMVWIIKSWGA